jgi:hypothetical protein
MKVLLAGLAATSLMVGTASAAEPKISVNARQGASIQSVIQGFVDAVYLYCLPYVLDDTAFSEDLHPQAPSQIIPASPRRARNSTAASWVIAGLGEIVLLEGEAGHTQCRVSAYGPPVGPTFNVVQQRIEAPDLGFVETASDTSTPRVVHKTFEMTRDGRRYSVSLNGNDPGAAGTRSRFSTLTATVREVQD